MVRVRFPGQGGDRRWPEPQQSHRRKKTTYSSVQQSRDKTTKSCNEYNKVPSTSSLNVKQHQFMRAQNNLSCLRGQIYRGLLYSYLAPASLIGRGAPGKMETQSGATDL